MKNFYPEQYKATGDYPINHNYLSKQFSDHEKIWDKVRDVVVQGDFTLGEAVDKFEKSFAELNGGKYAIGVGSGTDALFLSLKALNIGQGDEVITTPFTFFATIGAIVTAGATPVFVDTGDDFNIDASKIEAAISPRTKAIMPVHWSGNPCDLDNINDIANKHNLTVVADACHAISATYKDKGIAACSSIACFSMHPLKNLNVWGDGGVVVTDDEIVAQRLMSIRNHGLKNRDECIEFSYNSRLDTIQAVIAQHLLDNKIDNITEARISNAAYLDSGLGTIRQVKMPRRSLDKKHVYHLYMGLFEQRDKLQLHLQNKGIDAKVHYPIPMHLQPAAQSLGHQVGDFPQAEFIANNCLSLPVHEFIFKPELDFIIQSIEEFYRD